MSEKTKNNAKNDVLDEEFPSMRSMNVSSATELTGLMYRPPLNDDELESYQDLYDMEYSDVDDGV